MRIRPTATVQTAGRLGGLILCREAGRLVAWDAARQLAVWDLDGRSRGQLTLPVAIAAAAASEDGRCVVVATANNHLWWYDGALQLLFDQPLDFAPLAAALEPLGQYLVLTDGQQRTYLFTHRGQRLWAVETPRPLRQVVFVPGMPRFVGAADFGVVVCLDAKAQTVWRHGPVCHLGGLCSDGPGTATLVACFSDGIRHYDAAGRERQIATRAPCRLVACDYDGKLLLAALDPGSLSLLKPDGRVLSTLSLPRNAAAVALDALGERGAFALADGQVTLFQVDRAG
jgi:hypothetical protein